MEIISDNRSLDSLLGTYSRFIIPELQRPYAWEEDQVRDFVNDVATLMEVLLKDPGTTAEHLFGMVVSIGAANGPQSVVDGQQRLTTTTVAVGVLIGAYQALYELQKGGVQNAIAIECQVQMQFLRNLVLGDGVNTAAPRLVTSQEIRESYESIIVGGPGIVRSEMLKPAHRLRAAARIIKDELVMNDRRFDLNGAAHQLAHFRLVQKVLLQRLKFIHVRTTSPEAGYGLFETLNTRGQRLNALDLVKVWIMSQLAGRPVEAMVATQFRGLANDDTEVELRYLREYFRAQAFRSPDETNEVSFATDVRKHIFKDPSLVKVPHVLETEQLIIQHVDRMEEWYDTWLTLRGQKVPYTAAKGSTDEAILTYANARLAALFGGVLRHELPMPLLLHVAAVKDLETFARVVHDLERFFFRFKKICGGAVGPMERVYLDWCRRLASAPKSRMDLLGRDLAPLIDNHANDGRFAVRLEEKATLDGAAAQKTTVYLHQMIELVGKTGDPWEITVSGRHVIEIECVESAFAVPEDRLRLGNAMLVNDNEKKLLQGKSFADKKRLISKMGAGLSNPLSAQAFNEDTWGTLALERHARKVIKAANNAFSF